MNDQEWKHVRRFVAWGIVGLIILVGVSIITSTFFFVPHSSNSVYPYFSFHFGWFGGIFLIFILFWVVRWLFWPWRWRYHESHYDNPYNILKTRFAKGEITKDQFNQMLRDLEQHK